MEVRGDNKDLYENHFGNYATHCPRWAGMTNEERCDLAKAAKMCLYCLNPKVVYNAGNAGTGASHKCITNGTKNRYSCSVNRCLFHSWVCLRHKEENGPLLKKFSEELLKKNLGFTYLLTVSLTSSPLFHSWKWTLQIFFKVPQVSQTVS